MTISVATFSATLQSNMAAKGFLGASVLDFCDAIADGTINGIIGAAFTTVDAGSVPGTGAGAGVGLTGMIESTIASQILSEMVSGGLVGTSPPDIADALASTLVTEMGLATLTSTHTPVFVGTGTITPGSIVIAGASLSSAIQAAGVAAGFEGDSWPTIASAVGNGQAAGFSTATGTVTITGAPTGGPVVPGAGAGTGTIS